MHLQKVRFLLAWSMMKIAGSGSGSISQRHGSGDPSTPKCHGSGTPVKMPANSWKCMKHPRNLPYLFYILFFSQEKNTTLSQIQNSWKMIRKSKRIWILLWKCDILNLRIRIQNFLEMLDPGSVFYENGSAALLSDNKKAEVTFMVRCLRCTLAEPHVSNENQNFKVPYWELYVYRFSASR